MGDARDTPGPQRQAVKTTIVGGQPPGNERDLDAVPVGLEHALALAASHPEFRGALGRDPEAALTAAALELTSTEQAILRATPAAALDQMIRQVDAGLTTPDRRQFLERATAALALLVGGQALVGCDTDKGKEYGKPKDPVQMKGERKYGYPHGTMGARPQMEPPPMTPPDRPTKPPPTRPSVQEAQDPPERPRPRRQPPASRGSMGVRPDRSMSATRRRPKHPDRRITGIRPRRSKRDPLDDL